MKNYFFNSFNNNSYVYDGFSNLVFPLKKFRVYDSQQDFSRREDLLSCMLDGYQKLANKYYLFKDDEFLNSILLSENNYKQMLVNYPHPQLILNVTEQCNLRCNYCIYSGEYDTFRIHSSKKMSNEIMRKSIENFFNNISEWKFLNPNILPIISFYGGEPLLECEFILEAINYIESFNIPVILSMSTNATLLTQYWIEELVSHNVVLFISMDGDRETHNKNRVFPNSTGSFDDVFEKLKDVKKEIERQGKSQVLPLILLLTLDDINDIPTINNFFQKEKELFANIPIKISTVRKGSMDKENVIYASEEYKKLYEIFLTKFKQGSFNEPDDFFLQNVFGSALVLLYNRPFFLDSKNYSFLIGSSCVPGNKIFVQSDGSFHMCERINSNFPIGDYLNGINFKQAFNLFQRWTKSIRENCIDCAFVSICGICPALSCSEDGFEISKFCRKEEISHTLKTLYTILEENPNAYKLIKDIEDHTYLEYDEDYFKRFVSRNC